jgi:hypothetical protein
VRFDEILQAHAFMQTERPPLLWEADTDDERFLPMLGEMIVIGLGRGNALADLVLAVTNVVVQEDSEEDEDEPTWLEPGEYVAVTVKGPGADWTDDVWRAGEGPTRGLLVNVGPRADDAGAVYAYTRDLGERGGAVTVFLARLAAD